MTNEAIEHVIEVEKTVAKIRKDAQQKIDVINQKKQEKIEKINEELKTEIQSFRELQQEQMQANLASKIEKNKESIADISKEYDQAYSLKKDKLMDYIVKEVLKRYDS